MRHLMRGWTISLLLFVGFATAAYAQEKQAPPQGDPPKPFQSPHRTEYQLSNGLKVTVVPYGLIPKVNMELAVRGGAITAPKGQSAVASLLVKLLKEGTATRSAEDVANQAALLGGNVTAIAGSDEILIHIDGLSDGASRMLDLLADVSLHPKFPESELQRLKDDQLRANSISRARPQTIASEQFHRILYGDTGYGRLLPDDADVKGETVEQIRSYYQEYFVPSNAHLFIAGQFSGDLRKRIEAAFGSWKGGAAPAVPEVKASVKHTLELIDRPGAPQSTIYMGEPVIQPKAPDYAALEVTNSLLGGSFMSRIVTNIREQKGYTYSPHSVLETNAQNALWVQSADVTTKVTGASLHEIYGEIDRLRKEAPQEKEVQGIQNAMTGTFVLRNSSVQGILNLLRFVQLQGLPANYIDTYIPRVYAVKPADIQAAAEKYINPSKMTVVVVGDKATVESQVAPYLPKEQ